MQAADGLRTQSAGSHVLYKIKYGTLSRLISPMPASTRVARGTIGTATGTGDAYGQRARGNERCSKAGARRESIHNSPSPCAAGAHAAAARGGTDCPAGGSALGVWLAICMGNATYTGQNGIIKQLMHIKRVGRHQLPHAGRCLNPVGEAAPKQWGHQCTSRWAPSSGLTTTSRVLGGQHRWIRVKC